jgi:hypothetical protein
VSVVTVTLFFGCKLACKGSDNGLTGSLKTLVSLHDG